MKTPDLRMMAGTRLWWLILCVGILLIIGGFAYWIWPAAGYAVASQIFGWLLILAGIVQLCVSSGPNRTPAWGWWLVGGVIDIFIGFMLVRSIILSEVVFPYFLAFIFFFWGLESFIRSAQAGRLWWLRVINGILLCIIGYFFLEAGFVSNMWMVSFLASIAFIYWGFTLALTAYSFRPQPIDGGNDNK